MRPSRDVKGESNDSPFAPFRVVMFPDTAPKAPLWVSTTPANTFAGTPASVAVLNTVAFAGRLKVIPAPCRVPALLYARKVTLSAAFVLLCISMKPSNPAAFDVHGEKREVSRTPRFTECVAVPPLERRTRIL